MIKSLKATSLALVAVASFATAASTPVSAKGGGGHGPVQSNFGGGFHRPVHGPGSSHNPIVYRGHPGGGRGYGMGRGFGRSYPYGYGRGYGYGVIYSGASACFAHFHWSPKYLRCIPNYL